MADKWQDYDYYLNFRLAEKHLFARKIPVHFQDVFLQPGAADMDQYLSKAQTQNLLVRSLPMSQPPETLVRQDGVIRYALNYAPRHYIDLTQGYEAYLASFSAKSRSSIRRKGNKFAKHCGGELDFRCYSSPAEMEQYYRLARTVSEKTYQEKLMDAGLPETDEFKARMMKLAQANQVRGYLLFHNEQPVSYLYLPARGEVLVYQYLGFDPEYRDWSVGTVLLWRAIEAIFTENAFRYFDFTQGGGAQKARFGNQFEQGAELLFLRDTPGNRWLIRLHQWFDGAIAGLGRILEKLGLKKRIRSLLRFGK